MQRYMSLAIVLLIAGCTGKTDNAPAHGETASHSMPHATVEIVEATYGWNCKDSSTTAPTQNTVAKGNATASIAAACSSQGGSSCKYTVDVNTLWDPAPGCEKDFEVSWKCGSKINQQLLQAEANGKLLELACD